MSKIFDNLFLGSYADARNQNFLTRNGITHIVTVGAELKPLYPKNFKYLYIAAMDAPSYRLINYFDQIADFMNNAIENEKGKVFVHCYAGISRSTSSVLAYLMKYHGMTFHDGRTFVRSKRSIICPNPGFVHQLNTYQKNCNTVVKKPESKIVSSSLGEKTMSSALKNSQLGMTTTKAWGQMITTNPSTTTSTIRFGRTTFTGSSTNPLTNSTNSLNSLTKSSVLTSARKTIEEKKVDDSPSQNAQTATQASPKFDYFCRACGIKIFGSDVIVHNTGRTFNAHCNAIYVEASAFASGSNRTGFTKISCPNSKCNNAIGFSNLKGGKCGCNKDIGNVWGIYPLRVTYAKIKA